MPDPKRGLGRGLDALLGGSAAEPNESDVKTLSLASVRPNPKQPRRAFDEEALAELTESIRTRGVLQPIMVRPMPGKAGLYEIVAGERRWRASRMAGLTDIPVVVRELDDDESLAIALIENLQREDLNPMEEAQGLKELQDRLGLTQEQLAQSVGKSRSAVTNSMRLLSLSDTIQKALLDFSISAGHARALMSIGDDEGRMELFRKIVEEGLSVRQTESQAGHFKRHGAFPEHPDAGESSPAMKKNRAPAAPAPAAAVFDEYEQTLSSTLGTKVKFIGKPEKGRISVYFESEEQLQDLLERLGNE